MLTAEFQKSPFCESGACVEVAWSRTPETAGAAVKAWQTSDGNWHMAEAKPGSPVLTYTRDEWHAFKEGARAGAFDLPGQDS